MASCGTAGANPWRIWDWPAPTPCSRKNSKGAAADAARVRALAAYKAFLTLWKDAGPSYHNPILNHSKAEYEKLQQHRGDLPITSDLPARGIVS